MPSKLPSHLSMPSWVPAERLIPTSASNSQSQGLLPFLALRTWPRDICSPQNWELRINFTWSQAAASWFSQVFWHVLKRRTGTVCFSPAWGSSIACSRVGPSLGYHFAQDKKGMPRSQPRTTRQAGFAESLGSKNSLKTPKKKGKISKNENEYKCLCYPEHKATGTSSLLVGV